MPTQDREFQLIALAEAVFANKDKSDRWLNQPKSSLNGLTPIQAMKDEDGARLVEQMLKQIDSGHF